jgi:hypothetical protein
MVRRVWAASGALAVLLFLCGLLFADLLGTSNYPPLNATAARLRMYFVHNGGDVRALSFFHALSAVALLCFAAYLYGALRGSEASAGAVLAGGAAAAVFLLLSALAYRTLAEPAVARDGPLAHALVVISYLAGGPAIALPLALLIAAAVLGGGLSLPRWSQWLGLVAAVVSIASAVTLLGPMNNSSAAYGVLLLAAVLGFAWVAAASVLLALRAGFPADGVGTVMGR